jgi:hypothetical protein
LYIHIHIYKTVYIYIFCSGSGLENREYGRRGSVALTTRHPLSAKTLTLSSSAGGGHSVGIVRSPTKNTDFSRVSLVACEVIRLFISSTQLFVSIQYVLCINYYMFRPHWLRRRNKEKHFKNHYEVHRSPLLVSILS